MKLRLKTGTDMAAKKAMQKEKTKKGRKGEEEASSERRELPGLAILAFVLVSLIALITERAGSHALGPYLGTAYAHALNSIAGSLPVLFYLAAIGILGTQIFLGKSWWRQILIASLIGFLLALILSVQDLGKEISMSSYYGGWIGNFITQSIFLPVFGTGGKFGAYIVTCLSLFFVVVWGFQLSVAAMLSHTASVAGAMGKTVAEGWRKGQEDDEDNEDLDEEEELEEVAKSKSARVKSALVADPKPTKALRKRDERALPTEGDTPEEEQAKLEALLESGDLEGLDPLTIRKLRDLQLERKRVVELNEWETKNRAPEIGGLLGKKEDGEEDKKEKPKKASKVKAEGVAPDLFADEDTGVSEIASQDEFEEPTVPTPRSKKKSSKKSEPDPELELEPVALELKTSELPESEIATDLEDGEEFEQASEIAQSDVGEESEEQLQTVAKEQPAPAPSVKYDPYALPELDAIFPEPPQQPLEFTEEELHEQSKLLEDQLNNFKVRGKVSGIHPGPVITRYEVELAPGEKVNRISSLSDDLALALRAKSIRILAPIPGKSLVGIEVPNRKAQIVYIKEILASQDFHTEPDTLKICVGKTIAGDPYVADLARAPHLLIAGQTGSGKSVCINSIMASLLASKSPDELRMILVDPKVVELKPYDSIPHLLHPVITQPDVAVQALKWATVKMDERYEILAQCGVRNIRGFNQKVREGTLPESVQYNKHIEFGNSVGPEATAPGATIMPFIVIVIDELADLMMVVGKKIEELIARLAQKARAAGIHLILATQRPSVDVITGLIKANIPTRVAFQVSSKIDSRTVLDQMGAETLLGQGDMLYLPPGTGYPVRVHGAFVADDEVHRVVEHLKKVGVPDYIEDVLSAPAGEGDGPGGKLVFVREHERLTLSVEPAAGVDSPLNVIFELVVKLASTKLPE